MKKFVIVKIWIGLEIAAAVALATLVLLKMFVWKEADTGPTYQIPQDARQEVDIEDIQLPRDLLKDTYEEETAGAEATLTAESETITGNMYEADYPEEVMNRLEQMSPAQKAEILLLATPESFCEKPKVTVAGEVFSQAFSEKDVSGFFFSDTNLVSDGACMEMLQKLRTWSRDKSGMNLLLGYRGTQDAQTLSEKGFNLLCIGDAGDSEKIQAAADNCMIPALLTGTVPAQETEDPLAVIVETNDTAAIITAINDGNTALYSTDAYTELRPALSEAAENGEILPEALNKAAGYALSVRLGLTQLRPEEYEKEPPKAAPAPKKSKQLTPEEQAAQAAKQLQEQAAKEAQKAQKEAQKQAEQLQKQLAEQAAAAAAAAAAAQTPQ